MNKINPNERERYQQNVEGDFYVEKDMCMTCMMPELQAPELMGFDKESCNCYFKRQPSNPEELEHAIAAVAYSEIQGLRYAGNDECVLRRLVELDAAACCDVLTPKEKIEPESGNQNPLKSCLRKIWKTK